MASGEWRMTDDKQLVGDLPAALRRSSNSHMVAINSTLQQQ